MRVRPPLKGAGLSAVDMGARTRRTLCESWKRWILQIVLPTNASSLLWRPLFAIYQGFRRFRTTFRPLRVGFFRPVSLILPLSSLGLVACTQTIIQTGAWEVAPPSATEGPLDIKS